ncbi:MAG: PEP-CTERM sorting domain-containing protein [Planctomycetota bacterium]
MKRMILPFAVLAMCLASQAASAALIYDLVLRAPGQGIMRDQVISVTPRESVSGVDLLLVETVTAGTPSILGDDSTIQGGLLLPERSGNVIAFGADLAVDGSDGSFENLSTNEDGGAARAGTSDADTVAYIAVGSFLSQPGASSTAIDATTRAVVLGTVDLIAPTVGQTRFTLTDLTTDPGDFSTFSTGALEQAAIDSGGSFNGGSLTLSVAAVPEPSTWMVAMSVVGIVGFCRRRNRHS